MKFAPANRRAQHGGISVFLRGAQPPRLPFGAPRAEQKACGRFNASVASDALRTARAPFTAPEAGGLPGAASPLAARRRNTCASGFTLIEVLAALLFMAIVIPVAVEALHIASLSGEVATRKAEAARVADAVLNESIATTNWDQAGIAGAMNQNGHEYRWTLNNQLWIPDSTMELLTAEVKYTARGKEYSVRLNTLVPSQSFVTTTTMNQ